MNFIAIKKGQQQLSFFMLTMFPKRNVPLARYAAASSIFSMKIPYPVVGSLTRTWVTAPTGFPVAVPDKTFGLTLILDFINRCHSLRSLHLPPRQRSHCSPSCIIGGPDTSVSSKGQKNFVFFFDFNSFLQVNGRFLHTPTAIPKLT